MGGVKKDQNLAYVIFEWSLNLLCIICLQFQIIFHRITSRYPDDPRQPFWVEDGTPMKPLAKLSLIRQRLYKKSCSPDHDDVPFQEPGADFYEDHGT